MSRSSRLCDSYMTLLRHPIHLPGSALAPEIPEYGFERFGAKTTASEKAGFVFSPAWTRSLSKLSGTAYTLANLTVASVVLVVALEWVVRGSLQDVGTFITSSARPGMTTIAAVFALLVALDSILGRRYLSLIAVAPLCALVGLISAQKQTYLSDPLYPSDLLFGRQILELLPTMLKAQPFTAMLVGLGLSAAIASHGSLAAGAPSFAGVALA